MPQTKLAELLPWKWARIPFAKTPAKRGLHRRVTLEAYNKGLKHEHVHDERRDPRPIAGPRWRCWQAEIIGSDHAIGADAAAARVGAIISIDVNGRGLQIADACRIGDIVLDLRATLCVRSLTLRRSGGRRARAGGRIDARHIACRVCRDGRGSRGRVAGRIA